MNEIYSKNTYYVKQCDIDPYGIVHHTVYMTWLEESINKHISKLFNEEVKKDKNIEYSYKIVGATLKYIHSATSNDVIHVITTATKEKVFGDSVIFNLKQWISNDKNKRLLVSNIDLLIKKIPDL